MSITADKFYIRSQSILKFLLYFNRNMVRTKKKYNRRSQTETGYTTNQTKRYFGTKQNIDKKQSLLITNIYMLQLI